MAERSTTAQAREALVKELSRDVKDARVLEAIGAVPRERFVPKHLQFAAYQNQPLPIGEGQTISQPLMVAMMTEALQLTGEESVLEVGTGSGYQAAALSLLARRVVSVERIGGMAEQATRLLHELGYANVDVHKSDTRLGWPEGGPYDAIIVTAASPEVPAELLAQLAMAGRIVIPVGGRSLQELVRIVKTPAGAKRHNLGPCRFVPLLGPSGWPEPAPS
jgi:protein-L-isoaspartate(D-aspartate) O-methyltransferase